MLETDVKIPAGPVEIRPPETWALYGTALAVKQMRDAGARPGQIYHKLRISEDAYRDAIFEIRKKEGIEAMKKLDEETRAKIIELRGQGETVRAISETLGVSPAAINRVLAANRNTEQEQLPASETGQEAPLPLSEAEPDGAPEEPAKPVPVAVLDAVSERIGALQQLHAAHLEELDVLRAVVEKEKAAVQELTAWLTEKGGTYVPF